MRNRDEVAIVQAIGDPALANYPLPGSWHEAIQSAKHRTNTVDALEKSLRSNDRSLFLELFDIRLFQRYAKRFEPYQTRLTEWTEREVLPADNMGLRPAIARASVVAMNKTDRTYRVRWTWPQQRFTDECILAVCEKEADIGEDPREVAACFREPIDRTKWESGSGSRVIHAERAWLGRLVTVWAVVDLGFRLLFSHPLVLGTLGEPRRTAGQPWKLWSVFGRRGATGPKTGAATRDESSFDQSNGREPHGLSDQGADSR
jgi:hypothetical protein